MPPAVTKAEAPAAIQINLAAYFVSLELSLSNGQGRGPPVGGRNGLWYKAGKAKAVTFGFSLQELPTVQEMVVS